MSQAKSMKSQVSDTHARGGRVGLLAQGGGMRGVYSMAALAEIDAMGLRGSFDFAAGASSGAINLAYFLAGQAEDAVKVYTEIISNRKFVNPFRPWRIVDIDFLVDVALKERVPVHVDSVREASAELSIDIFDTDLGSVRHVLASDTRFDLFELFRATAALPALYNRMVSLDGSRYIDGGTRGGVPFESLLSAGCDLSLVILTRDPSFRRVGHGKIYQLAGRLMARGMPAAVKATIGARDDDFNRSMAAIQEGAAHGSVVVVAPSNLERLASRTTFDRAVLEDTVAMAREDVRRALG